MNSLLILDYTCINDKPSKNKSNSIKSKLESFSKFVGWNDDDDEEPAAKRTELTIDADIDLVTGKIIGQKSRSAVVKDAMKASVLSNLDSMDTLAQFALSERKESELKKVIYNKISIKSYMYSK